MSSTTPADGDAQKKSWFDSVVIGTPVLLTVVATFLVGRSSTEMTLAQYYRSVASQNQSKVADQWGFYQAKRIRGQILEGNADLLQAQTRDFFSREVFVDLVQEMANELHAAEKSAVKLEAKWGAEFKEVLTEADSAAADTKVALYPPAAGWKGEKNVLNPKNVQEAFDVLLPRPRKAKPAKDSKEQAAGAGTEKPAPAEGQTELLKEVIENIKRRKSEREVAPTVIKLKDKTLEEAIETADTRADQFYQRGKNIENVLDEFDNLVERQAAIAFSYQQLAARVKTSTAKNEGSKDSLAALERHGDTVRALTARLRGDYKALRSAYSARRYEDDARSNQDSAYLLEVKVYLNSARSDRHLFRSQMFMLAMLIAQAGVTIASLALAVKQKSLIWLLAALAGMIAILFGIYVFLDYPLPQF